MKVLALLAALVPILACSLLVLALACSSASIATVQLVSGTYVLSVVDGTNGCAIAGVTEGATVQGVPLTVSQAVDAGTPQNMTVTLGGSPGALLAGVMGTTTLAGTVGNDQVTLTPEAPDSGATPSGALNGCSYTANASLQLNFSGDTVQGTMTYTLNLTGSTCGALVNCQTVQAMSGVLLPPPSSDSGAHDG